MNCISVALTNAGICMKDMLVSCTVGTLNTRVLVDPNEEEEYEIANEFVISYLPGSTNLDCVELKRAKIKEETLRQIHKTAVSSCQ
jgi:ribonuclease PH